MRRIKVIFRDSKGKDIKTIEGNEGDDILSLAHEHDVDLEGESARWAVLSLDYSWDGIVSLADSACGDQARARVP